MHDFHYSIPEFVKNAATLTILIESLRNFNWITESTDDSPLSKAKMPNSMWILKDVKSWDETFWPTGQLV